MDVTQRTARMGGPTRARVVLWNLAFLAGISVPVFVGLLGVLALVHDAEVWTPVSLHSISEFTFLYVVLGWPVLVGGIVHQVVLLAIPRSWPAWQRRLSIVVLPLVVAIIWLSYEVITSLLSPYITVPFIVSLLSYAMGMRLP